MMGTPSTTLARPCHRQSGNSSLASLRVALCCIALLSVAIICRADMLQSQENPRNPAVSQSSIVATNPNDEGGEPTRFQPSDDSRLDPLQQMTATIAARNQRYQDKVARAFKYELDSIYWDEAKWIKTPIPRNRRMVNDPAEPRELPISAQDDDAGNQLVRLILHPLCLFQHHVCVCCQSVMCRMRGMCV
jgi:hypothetical protein